jgi:methyltransferase (TIGR00027 family)
MLDNAPSKTALRVALRRAAHQVLDIPPVFDDPLALRIVGATASEIQLDPRRDAPLSRGLRAFMAVRSRWAEERLARAVAAGVRQYVVLGAGLDTFSLRNPFQQLRIFEVDHPATQQFKRDRVVAAGLQAQQQAIYVAIDFSTQALPEVLAEAGFLSSAPAFFSWLGVVPYLEEAAILATLRFVASVAAPVEVVFDYAVDPALLSFLERAAVRALADRVAAAGEPFRTFFAPDRLHTLLTQVGLDVIEDLGTDELNQRYFRGRQDALRLRSRAGRLTSAGRFR